VFEEALRTQTHNTHNWDGFLGLANKLQHEHRAHSLLRLSP